MSAFADTLYHQPYISDKKEVYLEFIRKVLTMYQRNKNLFTKFAPDVYFEDIKNSLFFLFSDIQRTVLFSQTLKTILPSSMTSKCRT